MQKIWRYEIFHPGYNSIPPLACRAGVFYEMNARLKFDHLVPHFGSK